MDTTTLGLLATAISAPICAAILKLVPQRGDKYDGPPTESLMTREICISHRYGIDARLTRVENAVHSLEDKVFPTPKEDAKK